MTSFCCHVKDCLELLCACSVINLSVKDKWNRTAADVATAECKEILANRGDTYVTHVIVFTASLLDCQEVLVALDLSEDIEPLGALIFVK